MSVDFPKIDRSQVEWFIETFFGDARPEGYVIGRTFIESSKELFRPDRWMAQMHAGDLPALVEGTTALAAMAASSPTGVVAAMPICTFKTAGDAAVKNVLQACAITAEIDTNPSRALEQAEDLVGPATAVITSGGSWVDPATGAVEPKFHAHWKLREAAEGFEALTTLGETRRRLAVLLGCDTTGAPVAHLFRIPGSWHRKSERRVPCRIVRCAPAVTVDLEDAFKRIAVAEKLAIDAGLLDAAKQRRTRARQNAAGQLPAGSSGALDDIRAALQAVPNPDRDPQRDAGEQWSWWNRIIMTIWAATGGSEEGLALALEWSARSNIHDAAKFTVRWEQIAQSPPDALGPGTLYYEARQAQPSWLRPSILRNEPPIVGPDGEPVVDDPPAELVRVSNAAEIEVVDTDVGYAEPAAGGGGGDDIGGDGDDRDGDDDCAGDLDDDRHDDGADDLYDDDDHDGDDGLGDAPGEGDPDADDGQSEAEFFNRWTEGGDPESDDPDTPEPGSQEPGGSGPGATESGGAGPVNDPPPPGLDRWPDIDAEAFHGLIGEIVDAVAAKSEADPVAILGHLLVAAGNMTGREPFQYIGNTRHHANLYAAFIGETAAGRKGTALADSRSVLHLADDSWRYHSGLSSGEGLVYLAHDGVWVREKDRKSGKYYSVLKEEPIADKRIMVIEPEFAGLLQVMTRHGNILSEMIRRGWDGEQLEVTTRNNPLKASGAHISLIAHITLDELRQTLTTLSLVNGFANRFLFFLVRRAQLIPFPVPIDTMLAVKLANRLKAVLGDGSLQREIGFGAEARAMYEAEYRTLASGNRGGALFSAAVQRGAPIVRRLAMIYALLDHNALMQPQHLRAALAVWRHSEAAAKHLFGDLTGNPLADRILTLLREAGARGLSRTQIAEALGYHGVTIKADLALERLKELNLAESRRVPSGGGRPIEIWTARI